MKKFIPFKKTIYQRIGLFFFDHTITSATLWLTLIIFGVLSYGVFMQRQGFPNVDVPISVTSGTYFVNDKEKVDTEIVKPLSELLMDQSAVKSVTASSGDNFFSVFIEYIDGTNVASTQQNIQRAVGAAGFVPDNARLEYRVINATKIDNTHDVLLAVYQQTDTSLASLIESADKIAKDLQGTSGVEKVTVLTPFKSGINPASGQQVTLQQTFDRRGIRVNGTTVFYPSVQIGIVAKNGTDVIKLEKALNQRIAELTKKPANSMIKVDVSAGVAEIIESQIASLQKNLLEGLLIVLLVSLLLISWRAGLSTALGMVTVLLMTVGILFILGITLNTITLFALVLCIGLIVDDMTIMAEAIDAGRNSNLPNRDIVALAIKKVARASTAGTLVTMLAFSPMLFISGILGSFIRVLPITIIVSLAVSLLVSLSLIPFMGRYLILSKKSKKSTSRNPVIKLENIISTGLAELVRKGRKSHKKAFIEGIVALFISLVFITGSGVFFQKLKFDIFPSSKDSNALTVNLAFPNTTTINAAQAITARADKILADTLGNNIRDVTYVNTGSPTSATARVNLISYSKRDVTSPELVEKLNAAFANFDAAKVKVSQSDVGPPKDELPFRVQVFGEDTAKTVVLSQAIADYLQDREVIRTSNNTTATVNRVVIAGLDTVNRSNGKRLVEVQAGFNSDDVSALVTSAQKTVEKEFTAEKIASFGVKQSDVSFDFGNESNNQDSFKTMLIAFPVLLIVMYILLALLFRSMLQPVLIFTAIPFSFFGVAAGLYYTANPLSFFVMIGFFALIGIAVNNTILLTDYANQARREGSGAFESMALAVKARFRPLITTSLTSVVALIPLALTDPFWESLAVTLIFGLLSSTFLVIVTFPYLYLGAEFLRSRYSRRLTLAWALVLIAATALSIVYKPELVGVFVAVALLAMITTWLKGIYAKRLVRH